MTTFQTQLLAHIRSYIARVRREGTVGMSIDNLLQCVRPPSQFMDGAPQGPAGYAQMFRQLCASERGIAAFTKL